MSTTTTAPAVGSMVPLLSVYDMHRTVAFYRDVLGFEVEAEWEEDDHLYWAAMKCDDTSLMFNAEYEGEPCQYTGEQKRKAADDTNAKIFPIQGFCLHVCQPHNTYGTFDRSYWCD